MSHRDWGAGFDVDLGGELDLDVRAAVGRADRGGVRRIGRGRDGHMRVGNG